MLFGVLCAVRTWLQSCQWLCFSNFIRFISHAELTPGWALIWVNFDPIREIGPKVGGGRSFTRLQYIVCSSRFVLPCVPWINYFLEDRWVPCSPTYINHTHKHTHTHTHTHTQCSSLRSHCKRSHSAMPGCDDQSEESFTVSMCPVATGSKVCENTKN